jgi:alpha-glucosidase
VDSLSLQGVRTLTYINPYFTNVSAKSTGYTHNYFQEGVDEGYFVKNISGNAYLLDSGHFDFAMVDFTNPAARKWTKQIIQKNMLRCDPTGNGELGGSGGVYGWMHDFGEYLPFDSVLFSGGDPAAYHNAYPEEWSALAAEAVEECNNVTGGGSSDVVFFARSASLHSPKAAPLFWMGDQLVSWDEKDGLKSALAGMLTGGLTGHSLSHSDIGGFTVVSQGPGKVFDYHYERSKELLLRWIELSAFSDCIMRTHPGSSLANTVQVYDDAESLAFFASFARVHVALFDYRRRLIADASAYGHPVTRPMLLHFPSDAIVAAPESGGLTRQFMLGETLLVAPALDEGAVSVSAYLPTILSPEGRGDSSPQAWIHVWTNGSFPAGAWCSVAAPLGQPGVFFKQGDPEGIALQEAILSAV